jgi:hypothetical protein
MKRTRIARVVLCGIVIGAVALLTVAFARYPLGARANGIVRGSARPLNSTGRAAVTSSCNRSWWNLSPIVSPTSSFPVLYGVAATSFNDVWAVGYYNPTGGAAQQLIEHFNGQTWSISSVTAENSTLFGVTALASNNAWAVGTYFNGTLVEHWDGSAWTLIASPNQPGTTEDQLKSVVAVATNDIWAVGVYYNSTGGNAQLIEHWDGTSWSIVTGPNNGMDQVTLTSAAASSATDVWILGNGYITSTNEYRSFVEHWNGSAWTVTMFAPDPTTGNLPELNAIAANSGGVWVVGDLFDGTQGTAVPFVEHWNGASWSLIPSAATGSSNNGFSAIALGPNGDAWAVGWSYFNTGYLAEHSLIERWNGSGFSIVPDGTGASQYGNLSSVTELSRSFAFTVGETGPTKAQGAALAEEYSVLQPAGASSVSRTIGGPGIACSSH